MNKKQAYKIAIECIQNCMQPLAIDHNIVAHGGGKKTTMENRAKLYEKLKEAKEFLQENINS